MIIPFTNISIYNDQKVSEIVKKQYDKEDIIYLSECGAFDIETTQFNYNDEKRSFMYIWMFGFGKSETVVYGRTWEEFKTLLSQFVEKYSLNINKRMIIYVHNLSYEFQFMRKLFEWESVFAIAERKVLTATTVDGIEFRDNYMLSGMSLENVAKNLTRYKIAKLKGSLDYEKTRHEKTALTKEELSYCENDILIILYYIQEQLDIYKKITKIPLTNTGRVRKKIESDCLSFKNKYKFQKKVQSLTMDTELYKMAKKAFQGGFVHSSHIHTFKTIKNVMSKDESSAYPFAMVSEKFPMSEPKFTTNPQKIMEHINKENYGCLFEITLKNVRNKIGYESYISESKCDELLDKTVINGRVFSASVLTTTITDIDFKIIKAVYEYDDFEITKGYYYKIQYLPKEFINCILDLYVNKTTLKDVAGYELEYLLNKGMINSTYGMSVTDIVREIIEYSNDHEWSKRNPSDPEIKEQIESYNEYYKRTTYYMWGVYVTAYARRNLWNAILAVGTDYIYSDTDSCKYKNPKKHELFFENYNQNVIEKLKRVAEHYSIPFERFEPTTQKGVKKLIGVWEVDGIYNKFKTIGAKRYLYEKNGDFFLTCAGLGKKSGMQYIKETCNNDSKKIFHFFDKNMRIPAQGTGKKTVSYYDDEIITDVTDYLGETVKNVTIPSCSTLQPCEFNLSSLDKFVTQVEQFQSGDIELNPYRHISDFRL